MKLVRVLLLFLTSVWLPVQVQAQSTPSCGFLERKIQFADGAQTCVRDVALFKRAGLIDNFPTLSYERRIAASQTYAIATTANPNFCPFSTFVSWDWLGHDASSALPGCNARLADAVKRLAAAPGVECRCELVVNNGKSTLNQRAFLERFAALERQVLAGGQPLDSQAEAKRQEDERKAREQELARQDAERRAEQEREAQAEARRQDQERLAREEQARQEAERRAEQEREAQAEAQRQEQERDRRAALRPERRVALVVGNAAYKISPLDNPVNDATDMDTGLKRAGFQTTLLRNATLAQMREATRRFTDQLATADVALIYFAGHGIESRGRNYMVPVNADLKFEHELLDQAFDANQWLEMLEGSRSANADRVNLVILDACRNNNLIGARSWSRGLGRLDAPSGSLLAYSTAPGKVAADGPRGQRNSPFTKHLLRAMQQPNLPIEEVFKEVRRNVSRETAGAQVPWESTSLTGFFSFRPER